jgi:hypothetical protein
VSDWPTTATSTWNTSSIGDEHGQSRIRPNEPRGDQRVPRPGGNAGGVFSGKPLILLHHIGAKSGTERIYIWLRSMNIQAEYDREQIRLDLGDVYQLTEQMDPSGSVAEWQQVLAGMADNDI